MPTTTPIQALPIPILADIANVPLHVANLAGALEKQLVMIFATSAARTAAIASPVAGMQSYQQDTKRMEFYTGVNWEPLPGSALAAVTSATTTSSSGVTEVLHPSLAVTITVTSGRQYWIEVFGRFSAAGATATLVKVHALQGTIVIGSPVVVQSQEPVTGSGGAAAVDTTFRYPWTPAASGSWNLQIGVSSSTANSGTFGPGTTNASFAVLGG